MFKDADPSIDDLFYVSVAFLVESYFDIASTSTGNRVSMLMSLPGRDRGDLPI